MTTETEWYRATSDAKHVRQIVIHLPREAQVKSCVEGCLASPIIRWSDQNWAAMTLFTPGDTPERKGSVIFVKANGVVELLKDCPTRVAFSFYQFKSGGLLQIFVHVQSSAVEARSHSPFIVENGHWPDADDTKKLIPALIGREDLEVCFVADGPIGPCQGYFGLRVPLPAACTEALKEEWESLNDYNNRIPVSMRNFGEAIKQFEAENPMEENPILDEPRLRDKAAAVQKGKIRRILSRLFSRKSFLSSLTHVERQAVTNLNPLIYDQIIKDKKDQQSIAMEVYSMDKHEAASANEAIESLRKLSVSEIESLRESAVNVVKADNCTDQAEKAKLYRKAADLNPDNDLALMSYGCTLANQGNLREGIKWVERAVKVNPKNERARRNLQGMKANL